MNLSDAENEKLAQEEISILLKLSNQASLSIPRIQELQSRLLEIRRTRLPSSISERFHHLIQENLAIAKTLKNISLDLPK